MLLKLSQISWNIIFSKWVIINVYMYVKCMFWMSGTGDEAHKFLKGPSLVLKSRVDVAKVQNSWSLIKGLIPSERKEKKWELFQFTAITWFHQIAEQKSCKLGLHWLLTWITALWVSAITFNEWVQKGLWWSNNKCNFHFYHPRIGKSR